MKIKDGAVLQRLCGLSKTAKKMIIVAMENLEKDCGKENLERLGWSATDIHFMMSVVLNKMYEALGVPKDKYEEEIERFYRFLKDTSFMYNSDGDDFNPNLN